MADVPISLPRIRIHLTNVTGAGAGAAQLLLSLLPALTRSQRCIISKIYLPSVGPLSSFVPSCSSTHIEVYRRWLPNMLSRFLECTFFSHRFNGDTPLLVLGDLPFRCKSNQTVFVHTPHLLNSVKFKLGRISLKYVFFRIIFRLNHKYTKNVIVQTDYMKDALTASYPGLSKKIHVVPQPAPQWLLSSEFNCTKTFNSHDGLKLFYPAAFYPHKNHSILAALSRCSDGSSWPVQSLFLTIDRCFNPAPSVSWIKCVGFLSPEKMIQTYAISDALLFLSIDESYGLPLIEAMRLGLPIVCPDLPYARILCADQAIFFNPSNILSLESSIKLLNDRLASGWRPDWSAQLKVLPKSWDDVADAMIRAVLN